MLRGNRRELKKVWREERECERREKLVDGAFVKQGHWAGT